MALPVQAAPMAACNACSDSGAEDASLLQPIHWTEKLGGWKLNTRLINLSPSFDQARRYKQKSTLTHGNDDSMLTVNVERTYSERRRPIEQINLPLDKQKRAMLTIGYDVRAIGNEHLGIAFNGGFERRRLGFAALRGKSSTMHTLGVVADWVHAEQWRLSTRYTLDQSHNPHNGINRSIQLAAGARPNASEMAVALDYSPSFVLPDNFRVGIEARTDHLSRADAEALAMRDRNERTLAMKFQMTF